MTLRRKAISIAMAIALALTCVVAGGMLGAQIANSLNHSQGGLVQVAYAKSNNAKAKQAMLKHARETTAYSMPGQSYYAFKNLVGDSTVEMIFHSASDPSLSVIYQYKSGKVKELATSWSGTSALGFGRYYKKGKVVTAVYNRSGMCETRYLKWTGKKLKQVARTVSDWSSPATVGNWCYIGDRQATKAEFYQYLRKITGGTTGYDLLKIKLKAF